MSLGRDVLLGLLVCATLAFALHAARPPPALGRAGPPLACDVPVEKMGTGVVCLTAAEARARQLAAGDVIDDAHARDGDAHARMAPERLAAWRAPVDVNHASVDELASLDGIGPKLAERIVAARPFVTVDDVGHVRGLGMRRLARLRERLVLDE